MVGWDVEADLSDSHGDLFGRSKFHIDHVDVWICGLSEWSDKSMSQGRSECSIGKRRGR